MPARVNSTSGQFEFKLIAAQLLSANPLAEEYGPWIISVSLPIGAILFMSTHRIRGNRPPFEELTWCCGLNGVHKMRSDVSPRSLGSSKCRFTKTMIPPSMPSYSIDEAEEIPRLRMLLMPDVVPRSVTTFPSLPPSPSVSEDGEQNENSYGGQQQMRNRHHLSSTATP